MFDDEMRVAFKKMHEFSAPDGFVEITECVGDTIKYVANEPSVGLFFIQQHTRNAAPNLIKLKNKISRKSHETSFHTEDLNDSKAVVKSMKEYGNPIVNEMIKDINKSLRVISTKQPKIGLISSHNMSSVMSSAREKATNIKWPQFDSREWGQSKSKRVISHFEGDELPVSSPSDDVPREESSSSSNHKWIPLLEKSYDEFKANREAELEQWLEHGQAQRNGDGF